jgi:hypothetical protein
MSCSVRVYVRVINGWPAHQNMPRVISLYLEADVLSFTVTVQPQHQVVTSLGLTVKVVHHMSLQDRHDQC